MELMLSAALPVVVLILMINLGLELTPLDFRRVLSRPRVLAVGLAGQMILLPVVGFLVVILLEPPPEIALGLLLLAVAPGGLTSNLLTRYAGGDVALSISLTAVASLLSAVSVPLVFLGMLHLLGEPAAAPFSMLRTSLTMFLIVTLPVLAGMAVRAGLPGFSRRHTARFRRVAVVLLVSALSLSVVAEFERVLENFAVAGSAALALNLTMMGLAYAGSRLLGVDGPQRIAISLECGLQNVTLAITLVALIGLPAAAAIPAQIYAVVMLVNALIFMAVVSRRSARGRAPA